MPLLIRYAEWGYGLSLIISNDSLFIVDHANLFERKAKYFGLHQIPSVFTPYIIVVEDDVLCQTAEGDLP